MAAGAGVHWLQRDLVDMAMWCDMTQQQRQHPYCDCGKVAQKAS